MDRYLYTVSEKSACPSAMPAAKLYEIGRLSSGRAAELAGLGRVAFFDILKSYKVPVANLTREELKKDFESARKMRG